MSTLKKTKVVYESQSDGGPKDQKEILVDMIINLDQISTVLPGKRPGLVTLVMANQVRYTCKDDVQSFIDKGDNDSLKRSLDRANESIGNLSEQNRSLTQTVRQLEARLQRLENRP